LGCPIADGREIMLWVETGLDCNESAVRCHPDVLCQIETQRKRTVSSGMSDGSPASPRAESLTGLVERVTYHNAENGFCVLRIKVRGHKELETLIRHAPSVTVGE
jgi:hypothetical protein